MPQITTAVNLNGDFPTPTTGNLNIIFQSDGGAPLANISAYDPIMVGDDGTGGFPGNVPAPAAGDAAAGKFLMADGTWAVPNPGFSSGNSINGYWVKDPTGHIRQWGVISTDINSGTVGVSFPTLFTDVGSISVTVTTKSATDRITFVVDGSVTTSGFSVGNNGSGGYAYWSADGN